MAGKGKQLREKISDLIRMVLARKKEGAKKFMILVIAEKEALGKYIAEALPGVEKTSKSGAMGRIEKGEYIVVWTNGHLLTLKDPDEIDKKYKKWSLDTLPIYFDPWEKRVVKDAFQKKGQKNYKEIRV